MLQRMFCVLSIAMGSILSAGPAWAQTLPDNMVGAAAAVSVRPAPTKLRAQIELRSYGKTPEVALQNLAARRAGAIARLKQLKADAASISFGIPRVEVAAPAGYGGQTTGAVPPGASPYAAPPSYYPSAAPAAPGWAGPARPTLEPPVAPNSAPKKAVPRLYMAAGTLRADWRLEASAGDQLAALAARIRENVKATDLAGAAVAQKLSPEEQEAIEELEIGLTPPSSPPTYAPGVYLPPGSVPPVVTVAPGGTVSRFPAPTFLFVATLSAAERKAAIAKAFALARADVESLAEAAGMKVGTIARLEPVSMAGALVTARSSPLMVYDDGGNNSLATYKNDDEDTAADANGTTFTVAVSLAYHLLPAAAGK